MLCLAVFVNILLSKFVSSIDWVYVSTPIGINDTTCWTSRQHTSCATINLALKELQLHDHLRYSWYLHTGIWARDTTEKQDGK